jgi:hypothetical protein
LWGGRLTGYYDAVKDWQETEEFIPGKSNVELADARLRIKIGILTNFMKVLDKSGGELQHFYESCQEIKSSFVDLQVRTRTHNNRLDLHCSSFS